MISDEDRKLLDAVGRRIGELRRKKSLTQAHVAERVEMTVTNYQRIEHGLQNLTLSTLAKVADAIGVKNYELLKAPREARPKVGVSGHERATQSARSAPRAKRAGK